jgi:transposase
MARQVFCRWDVSQFEMFPPTFRELVPAGHLVHFVRRLVVEDLDLGVIYAAYTEIKGQPPYDPRLMTGLLLYCYSRGIYTSRAIERACEERLDVRALVGSEQPDHSTIAKFRKDHLEALSGLFVQVLALCRDAGMAKLGHVALDGTKMQANASKHSAMSYRRMGESVPVTQADRGAGLRADQGGPRLQAIPAARADQREGRVGAAVHRAQRAQAGPRHGRPADLRGRLSAIRRRIPCGEALRGAPRSPMTR